MPTKDNTNLIGKRTKPVPVDSVEIGADLSDELVNALIEESGVDYGGTDISALESFAHTAQTREQIYSLIDLMAQDDRIKAILDTYTEDVIETNEQGKIVWCESSDEDILKYVNYLLMSLKVDENSEEWVRSFIKYGDLYLRLYRQSDYNEEDIFESSKEERESFERALNESLTNEDETEGDKLQESVLVNVHSPKDHFVHYVEKVDNPCEMFDLTRLGTTRGFIKAPVSVQNNYDAFTQTINPYVSYKMRSKDITVYGATDFVHATLNSNVTRSPEEVQIFRDEESYNSDSNAKTYKVNRGQSMLYSQFKVWRELSLLENSILLNRITRSAIIRILNIEVGDMPKEKAQATVSRIKQNIEQKSAFKVGQSMAEYTNPGPIENAIYIPTHEGKGAISASTLGGDYDPKQLTDLSYFQDKLYGSFRVPKQFFNLTDDGAGFNGGASLTIISSRYGKAIKSIQKAYCQLITNLINTLLWDKGLKNYINKFTIKMQTPVTQEELDRRENLRNRMGVNQDVMNLVGNVVEDKILQLKITKSLLSNSLVDPEVISLIQEQIDIEEEKRAQEIKPPQNPDEETFIQKPHMESNPVMDEFEQEIGFTREEPPMEEIPMEEPQEPSREIITDAGNDYLPSASELGQNFVDNN